MIESSKENSKTSRRRLVDHGYNICVAEAKTNARKCQCIVVSRGSWRLTGHQLHSPLDHVQTFLHVCLVVLQYREQRVVQTEYFLCALCKETTAGVR